MAKTGALMRELEDGIIKLKTDLNNLDSSDEMESNEYNLKQKKLNALLEILNYVDSYKWVKHQNVIDKINFIRKCRYDYNLIRQELNITNDSLKSFMYRINSNLSSKIGSNTIKLILDDSSDLTAALIQFRILSGKINLEDLLLSDCFDRLPDKKYTSYSLKECLSEIEYLYKYSKIGLEFEEMDLDKDKLAFLRFIMESETEKYREEQKKFLQVLQGKNLTIEDYLYSLSQKEDFEI